MLPWTLRRLLQRLAFAAIAGALILASEKCTHRRAVPTGSGGRKAVEKRPAVAWNRRAQQTLRNPGKPLLFILTPSGAAIKG